MKENWENPSLRNFPLHRILHFGPFSENCSSIYVDKYGHYDSESNIPRIFEIFTLKMRIDETVIRKIFSDNIPHFCPHSCSL